MTDRFERPDVARVLASLKDFQRETVEHVFNRLYTATDRTHRYLVADEVGLGKTLVARGVVARTIDHLWDSVDRIDIVYICSSGDIARQNVNRLNITDRADWALSSRVTLLPTQLKDIQKRKVNFIAFTPGTTFKLASSGGHSAERVLLYWLLDAAWGAHGTGPMNLLQGYVQDHERFRARINRFHHDHKIDALLQRKFAEALDARELKDRALGIESLRSRFDSLCRNFARARKHIPQEERRGQNALIGELRAVLASTCIRALEPDLVILDEFQRFKDLLTVDTGEENDDEGEEARLARELFDYSDGVEKTRILLLSATPYKMYTTADEAGVDDHYSDFVQTLRFLHDNSGRTAHVADLLRQYRQSLCRTDSSASDLSSLRDVLQRELLRVMVRTERLSSSINRNGMLREVPTPSLSLNADDVMAYGRLEGIAKHIKHPDTIEYWKAAPYLLSFMDDYLLKRNLEKSCADEVNPELVGLLRAGRDLFLPDSIIDGTAALNPPHARLRWLLDTCLGELNWKLLWLPATLPYYRGRGAFSGVDPALVTKRLVFSAWQVAPKAIAALVSYEAERRMLEGASTAGETLAQTRERLVPLLRFSRDDGRLTGMPVLGLLYPSLFLASVGETALSRRGVAGPPDVEEHLERLEREISAALRPIIARRAGESRTPDEAWYWAAPILLDEQLDSKRTRSWLSRDDLAERWAGTADSNSASDGDDPEEGSAWSAHVHRLADALNGTLTLGTPPADLPRVLADIAIAGPGVTALRALGSISGGRDSWRNPTVRDSAGVMASAFRTLFNVPEVIAMLRAEDSPEPYWRRMLAYAVDGNLQAVLDEYVHLLRDALGLFGKSTETVAGEVAAAASSAIGLRTAPVVADELRPLRFDRRPSFRKHRMRARFAVRFGDDVDIEGKRANRKDAVRGAFNSPFWPFVLATTSVGQEGLDFHLYCHAVVHWNLPSNPVDLEQREGRVHRFKGHAIRKNVARRYAQSDLTADDRWEVLFARARAERSSSANDIVPFWVFQVEGGAHIERHVPALPMSRDEVRHRELRRSLAVYRMVFGQPRQDELLEYLMTQMSGQQVQTRLTAMQIDLSPVASSVRDSASGRGNRHQPIVDEAPIERSANGPQVHA